MRERDVLLEDPMESRSAHDAVRRWVADHRADMRRLLADLVAIASEPGTLAQRDCQDLVERELAATPGIEIDRWVPDWDRVRRLRAPRADLPLYVPLEDRDPSYPAILAELPQVVGTAGTPAGPRLVLNGHVDVVAPGDRASWHSDPFRLDVRDGRAYGRGTMDMKAGLVAAVYAVKALAELRLATDGSVSVASVVEEETGGNGTLALLERGHIGDGVVFAEPTGLHVVHRHIGIQVFEILTHGRAGGVLRASWGDSAIPAMGQVICALDQLHAARRARAFAAGGYEPDDDPAFINVGTIEGGRWLATTAPLARAAGVMGVLPDELPEQALDALRETLAAISWSDDWTAEHPPTVGAPSPGHPGAELAADHALVGAFVSAGAALGDGRVRATRAGAMVCDAKIVGGGGWAPSIALGPSGGGLHAADEHVDLDSMYRCAELFVAGAVRFLDTQPTDVKGT
jgi:acetylornithine deacetylase